MSSELSRLHEVASAIDDALGESYALMGTVSTNHRKILQSVDELRQSVHCLSIFSRSLSEAGKGEGLMDVADLERGIYLQGLRDILVAVEEVT